MALLFFIGVDMEVEVPPPANNDNAMAVTIKKVKRNALANDLEEIGLFNVPPTQYSLIKKPH